MDAANEMVWCWILLLTFAVTASDAKQVGDDTVVVATYNLWNVMFNWDVRKLRISQLVSIITIHSSGSPGPRGPTSPARDPRSGLGLRAQTPHGYPGVYILSGDAVRSVSNLEACLTKLQLDHVTNVVTKVHNLNLGLSFST